MRRFRYYRRVIRCVCDFDRRVAVAREWMLAFFCLGLVVRSCRRSVATATTDVDNSDGVNDCINGGAQQRLHYARIVCEMKR